MRLSWKTPINFAKSLATNIWWLAKGKRIYAESDVIEKRANTCEGCSFFDPVTRQCIDCTCFVDLKVNIKSEKCPQDFW